MMDPNQPELLHGLCGCMLIRFSTVNVNVNVNNLLVVSTQKSEKGEAIWLASCMVLVCACLFFHVLASPFHSL